MSKTIHITFDPLAHSLFSHCFGDEDASKGFYVFKDYLNEGPLKPEVGVNFDQARAEYYYKYYQLTDKQLSELPTTEKDILVYSNRMSNGEDAEIVLWMGNNELDVIGYYFILHVLKKHAQNIAFINIAGLPFIDANGKLYFPKRISELDAASLIKAQALKRKITPTEIEVDGDEWKVLREENADLRILAGNKKVKSVSSEILLESIRSQFNPSSRQQLKNVNGINTHLGTAFSERLIMKMAFDEGLLKKVKSKTTDETDGQIALEL